MKKQISIIVPVYNGQDFIRRCIDSLLSQKQIELLDIEILLINDGSKDQSLAIIEEYKKLYPKIFTIVNQKNKGAAYTRNKGIRLASGEYVSLVDQDDYVDDDYVYTLLKSIANHEYDVVQSGFKLTNTHGNTNKTVMPINTEFGGFLAIPAWAKIYRTQFLLKNDITFFDNNIGEDSVFTTNVILSAGKKRYGTINYAGYNNYFENASNVTNTLHKGLSESVNIIALLDELNSIKSDATYSEKLLHYNIIRTTIYYLLSYGRSATSQRFLEVYDDLFSWLRKNVSGFSSNRYVIIKPKGESLSASMGIKMMILLHRLRIIPVFAKIYCKGEIQ